MPGIFGKLTEPLVPQSSFLSSCWLGSCGAPAWLSVPVSSPHLHLLQHKEVAMAELPHHIDLLRWVPKASLLSLSVTLGLVGMVQSLLKHTCEG